MSTDEYARFASFYDQWARSMGDADVEFYTKLALGTAGPVIELGAGSGRVSVPIAQAGCDITAVDRSGAMLAIARERARAAAVQDRITFVHADMRTYVAPSPAALVIVPFRSFLHLRTSQDQLACLASVRASLRPGGRFALNVFVPDPAVIVRRQGERTLEGEFVDDRGRRCEMWSETTYDVVDQRMHMNAISIAYDGDAIAHSVEAALELRMIYRYEMEHLLARAGFEIEALYGWFDERPLTEECREMIWIARNP